MKLIIKKSSVTQDAQAVSRVPSHNPVRQAAPRKPIAKTAGVKGNDSFKVWIGVGVAAFVLVLVLVIVAVSRNSSQRSEAIPEYPTVQASRTQPVKKKLKPLDELGGMTMEEWCKKTGDTKEIKERKKRRAQHNQSTLKTTPAAQ